MNAAPPDALLLIGSACPHCASTAEAALRLVKEGRIGRLEIVNLDAHPAVAAEHGVRTVPWLRIGPFELTGALGSGALADWADRAATGEGWGDYLLHLLSGGELDRAVALVRGAPQRLGTLIGLLAADDLDLGARIGASAVFEELAGSDALRAVVPQLEQLTLAARADMRADACHFLGLAGDPSAGPAVRRLLDDDHAEVREIAAETLAVLDLPMDAREADRRRPAGADR
jgi:hypothetical protein